MSRHVVEPERLADLPAERDLVGVSALMRAAAAPPKIIAPAARQRIRGRLYASLAGRGPVFHARWRLALILVFTLAVGGVVGAATHSVILRRLSPHKDMETSSTHGASGKCRISQRSRRSTPTGLDMPTELEVPPAFSLEPAPTESPAEVSPDATVLAPPRPSSPEPHAGSVLSPPSPRPSASPVDDMTPPTAVSPVHTLPAKPAQHPQLLIAALPRSTSSHRPVPSNPSSLHAAPALDGRPSPTSAPGTLALAESSVLAQAIRTLRVDGDASAALKLLDECQARFTEGALGPEASAVRIEALLKLGRTGAALADLESLPLYAMPRRDEWHVVRGELRGQAGRWSNAEADFAVVLSGHVSSAGGDLAERALWGRAVARSHQGNVAGARADTLEYLQKFPSGRFAGLAHRALLAP